MDLERDKSACSVSEHPECCGSVNPGSAIPGVEENSSAVVFGAVKQVQDVSQSSITTKVHVGSPQVNTCATM